MASYNYTFTSGDTVTPTKLNDARTVSDIVNADIKSDAAIAGTKIAPAFGAQDITVSTANRSITNTGNFALSFGTNNTERVRITNDGNVGIGTSSPAVPLHVVGSSNFGTINVSSTSANAEASISFFDSGDTSVDKWVVGKNVGGITSDAFCFYKNGNLAVIDASGNVGIGTSSPTFRFVAANNATDGVWAYSSSSESIVGLGGYANAGDGAFSLLYNRTSGFLAIRGGTRDTPTERVRIDASGNVGIGTSSPVNKLDCVGNDVVVRASDTRSTGTPSSQIRVQNGIGVIAQLQTFSDFALVNVTSNHNLELRTNNTQRVIVKSTGQVRFTPLAADPAGGEAGDVYYNSATNKLKVYNGSSWVDLH